MNKNLKRILFIVLIIPALMSIVGIFYLLGYLHGKHRGINRLNLQVDTMIKTDKKNEKGIMEVNL